MLFRHHATSVLNLMGCAGIARLAFRTSTGGPCWRLKLVQTYLENMLILGPCRGPIFIYHLVDFGFVFWQDWIQSQMINLFHGFQEPFGLHLGSIPRLSWTCLWRPECYPGQQFWVILKYEGTRYGTYLGPPLEIILAHLRLFWIPKWEPKLT